ncbi:Glycosyl hydrolase family 38 protein [Perilla frutescens var. frutescens]|nr:Glycosyl hydrolase family 38 protein [Perilla frutescens var. frutescens]
MCVHVPLWLTAGGKSLTAGDLGMVTCLVSEDVEVFVCRRSSRVQPAFTVFPGQTARSVRSALVLLRNVVCEISWLLDRLMNCDSDPLRFLFFLIVLVSVGLFCVLYWFKMAVNVYGMLPFNGKNDFNIWKQKVKCVLIQQRVAKAIAGDYSNEDTEPKRVEMNELACSTIMLNLSDSVIRKMGNSKKKGESRSKSRSRQVRKCYNCGESNHFIKDYPLPKKNNRKKEKNDSDHANVASGTALGDCYMDSDHGYVSMANEKKHKIMGIGDVCLKFKSSSEITLKNVKYVHDLCYNLISCVALEDDGFEGRWGNSEPKTYKQAMNSSESGIPILIWKGMSLKCHEVTKVSWAELEAFETNKEGSVELSRSFRACKELDICEDINIMMFLYVSFSFFFFVVIANVTRSNHIMWTMGTDFKYQYAYKCFQKMDKLIYYVNQDGCVNAFYSTLSIYINAKYALDESWPLKSDDYFPSAQF